MGEITNNKITHSWIAWVSLAITSLAFIGWCYDHFSDNNPKLTFTIIKEISLLNEKANIPSIHILLDSIDIKETNSNISIYSIKIANEGKQHITSNMYDGEMRLLLKQGKLISKPIVVNASSYINSHLTKDSMVVNDSILHLPCIPLDKDDSFVLDLIILHSNDNSPIFDVEGKISGQKNIFINRRLTNTISFMEKVYDGGFLVNFVRFIFFFVFGLNIIILLMYAKEIPLYICRRRKIRLILKGQVSEQIRQDFSIEDDITLRLIYHLISYSDEKASKEYNKIQKTLNSSKDAKAVLSQMPEEQRMIFHMVSSKYWIVSGDRVSIDKKLQREYKYLYKKYKQNKE